MFHCSSSKLIFLVQGFWLHIGEMAFKLIDFSQMVYPNIMLMQFSPSMCSQNTCIIAKYITDFIMVHVLWYKTLNKQTNVISAKEKIWIEVDFFFNFQRSGQWSSTEKVG